MTTPKFIRRLYEELPGLEKAGVIQPEASAKLRAHYGAAPASGGMNLARAVFTAAGALCMGLGVILLFAYNWDAFPRTLKTALSLLPLLAAQVISGRLIFKNRAENTGAREGAAVFHFLAIGAAIALIGQVYHLPSDFSSFMLAWMLLSIPLIYLLDSGLAAILYLAGITAWAAGDQNAGGYPALFWPLALLSAPFLAKRFRTHSDRMSSIWLFWAAALCMTVSLGVSLEKNIPGLWIPAYAAFFAAVYLAGVLAQSENDSAWQRPLRTFGALGILVFSYVLTFKGPWEQVGWHYYREGGKYHAFGIFSDHLLLFVFLTAACLMLARVLARRNFLAASLGALPVIAAACYLLYGLQVTALVPSAVFNLYLLAVSIGCVVYGIGKRSLGTVNGGMLILGVLIMTRFVDSSFGILGRAVVFIFLGACFLGTNAVLSKRFYRETPHA